MTEAGRAQLTQITHLIIDSMPFCRLLGITLESVSPEQVTIQLPMDPKLIGNTVSGILHGGVIASLLDSAGGAISMVHIITKHLSATQAELAQKLKKISTIDFRIDYLLVGRGSMFKATAKILRAGNKIAVARIELHNDSEELIAVGTGAYLVG